MVEGSNSAVAESGGDGEEVNYNISLTRLVDGEITYTMCVEGELVGEFPGHGEAHDALRAIKLQRRAASAALILGRLNEARADRACAALRRLQEGAAVALAQLGQHGDGPVADVLIAVHRECCAGLSSGGAPVNEASE